ncbi:MAG: hypothetical protein GY761_01020 [Hyphomicrobiales bacterium]|nr:hypothetical protein [Hyphomicrobiales bacterium]
MLRHLWIWGRTYVLPKALHVIAVTDGQFARLIFNMIRSIFQSKCLERNIPTRKGAAFVAMTKQDEILLRNRPGRRMLAGMSEVHQHIGHHSKMEKLTSTQRRFQAAG